MNPVIKHHQYYTTNNKDIFIGFHLERSQICQTLKLLTSLQHSEFVVQTYVLSRCIVFVLYIVISYHIDYYYNIIVLPKSPKDTIIPYFRLLLMLNKIMFSVCTKSVYFILIYSTQSFCLKT